MFRLDNILEQWAAVYKPLSHSMEADAKPKDRAFFRIQEIELQSAWSRNMAEIDHPCLLFRTNIEANLDGKNPKFAEYFWGIYLAVKQKSVNNVTDELGATDCKFQLDSMCISLLAFLFALQDYCSGKSWPNGTPTSLRAIGESLTDVERRQVRAMQLEKTSWWTTPVHLNGWWLLGLELHALDPRQLCIVSEEYL